MIKGLLKKILSFIILFNFSILLSGCWDRTEINDIALITASSYDLAPEGGLQYSVQIMVPASGQGGGQSGSGEQKKKSFIVETAIGLDPGDAERNIQTKFPRKLFRGHRRVIIVGEDLAKKGLEYFLDSIGRDPQNRLRTNVLVAKGKKGIDMLEQEFPMERIPTEAMREMIGLGYGITANIRDLLIASSSEGIQPIAVAIEQEGEGKEGFEPTGLAVFKDLKLVGYIDSEKTEGYLWLKEKFNDRIVATTVPKNAGIIRINVRNEKARITPTIKNGKPVVDIKIKGEGSIYGNSTKLDLSDPKNALLVQNAVKKRIKNQVENTISTVQKETGSDIFGFGSTFNQFENDEWKGLKNRWNDIFPDLKVNVSVDFKINTTGMSGPPLYLKKDEVIK